MTPPAGRKLPSGFSTYRCPRQVTVLPKKPANQRPNPRRSCIGSSHGRLGREPSRTTRTAVAQAEASRTASAATTTGHHPGLTAQSARASGRG